MPETASMLYGDDRPARDESRIGVLSMTMEHQFSRWPANPAMETSE
jgi:hypothetical protein